MLHPHAFVPNSAQYAAAQKQQQEFHHEESEAIPLQGESESVRDAHAHEGDEGAEQLFVLNPHVSSDPRYTAFEAAAYRQRRALVLARQPAATKLRVADFLRQQSQRYHYHDATAPLVIAGAGAGAAGVGSGGTRTPVISAPTTARATTRASTPMTGAGRQGSSSMARAAGSGGGGATEPEDATCNILRVTVDEAARVHTSAVAVLDGGLCVAVGHTDGTVSIIDGTTGTLLSRCSAVDPHDDPLSPYRAPMHGTGAADADVTSEEAAAPVLRRREVVALRRAAAEGGVTSHLARTRTAAPASNNSPSAPPGAAADRRIVSLVPVMVPNALCILIVATAGGLLVAYDSTTMLRIAEFMPLAGSADVGLAEVAFAWSDAAAGVSVLAVRSQRGRVALVGLHVDVEAHLESLNDGRRYARFRLEKPPRPLHAGVAPITAMAAFETSVWAGDAAGNVLVLDSEDLGRVVFAPSPPTDVPIPITAVAVSEAYVFAAMERDVVVYARGGGIMRDRPPLAILQSHRAAIVQLILDTRVGHMWSRDASGCVQQRDATAACHFALRRTVVTPADAGGAALALLNMEQSARLWSVASNGMNCIWRSGHATDRSDALLRVTINEAALQNDGERLVQWGAAVDLAAGRIERRREVAAAALEAATQNRLAQTAFGLWQRFAKHVRHARLRPTQAAILARGVNHATASNAFQRWLQLRQQRRLRRIALRGVELLLDRVAEERAAAFLRRWRRYHHLRVQQRTRAALAAMLERSGALRHMHRAFITWRVLQQLATSRRSRHAVAETLCVRGARDVQTAYYGKWLRFVALGRNRAAALAAVTALRAAATRGLVQRYYLALRRFGRVKQQRQRRAILAVALERLAAHGPTLRRLYEQWRGAAATLRTRRLSAERAALAKRQTALEGEYATNVGFYDRVDRLHALQRRLEALKQQRDELQSAQDATLTSAVAAAASAREAARERRREAMVVALGLAPEAVVLEEAAALLARHVLVPSRDTALMVAMAKESRAACSLKVPAVLREVVWPSLAAALNPATTPTATREGAAASSAVASGKATPTAASAAVAGVRRGVSPSTRGAPAPPPRRPVMPGARAVSPVPAVAARRPPWDPNTPPPTLPELPSDWTDAAQRLSRAEGTALLAGIRTLAVAASGADPLLVAARDANWLSGNAAQLAGFAAHLQAFLAAPPAVAATPAGGAAGFSGPSAAAQGSGAATPRRLSAAVSTPSAARPSTPRAAAAAGRPSAVGVPSSRPVGVPKPGATSSSRPAVARPGASSR